MSQFVGRFLVFVSSAAVLVLEILAGRLIAPYVGVSLETFTGVIGTVLAAIAVGSWVGGRLADSREPAPLLGQAFVVSGILAMLAPTLTAALGAGLRGGGAAAVVILTLVAFFAPAAVLSAVTPLVVKVRLVSLDQTGEVVGSFSAVGTAGALVGTFVTGFVLLTAFPSRPVVLVVGLVLVAIGVWLHLKYRSGSLGPTVGGAGLAALGLVLAPGPCQWETSYSCASVLVDQDNASGRTLQLDLLAHSYVDLDDPTNLKFRYTREFAAAVEATAKAGPVNTLGIGGGGFTMPRYFAATRPGSVHTVFEIDDSLVDIAIEELGLDPAAIDLTVETSDARLGLARRSNADVGSGTEFDVVVGDAFGGLSVPWHLTTLEFLELLKTSMAPDGVYVMNLIDYPDHRFLRAEIATLQRVFDDVALIVPEEALAGTSGGNSVVVASDVTIDELALADALQQWDSDSVISSGAGLEKFVGNARVLTDDFAPVDQIIDAPVGKG